MTAYRAAVLSPAEHLELVAAEVAVDAAAYVRTFLGSARAAGTKSSPTDVVTETDLASEARIRAQLHARCPGSTIVGEEYDTHAGESDVGWVVDPIDGTVNFLYGLPVVSVSIAATLAGEIVAGAVVDVLNGTTFAASLGNGARRDGVPIHASAPDGLSASLVGTGFSYQSEIRAEQAAIIADLLPACRDIRCMGSAALNLCFVAAGQLDAYFERGIKLYDYAAGALIASEAGAIVEPPASADALTWAAAPSIAAELEPLIMPTNQR